MNIATHKTRKTETPTWDIAYLFPPQGGWHEEEYLELDTNRLIELTDGFLEVLPMPTMTHQLIALYLYRALLAFAAPRRLGTVLAAPFPIQLREGVMREPDVMFMLSKHASQMDERYWKKADLVMEVVSNSGRRRDLTIKRREYARAGIPEYWIVEPQKSQITVLHLAGTRYTVHGTFSKGGEATSALLEGFQVDVSAAMKG